MDRWNLTRSAFLSNLSGVTGRLKLMLLHPRQAYDSNSIRQFDAVIVILALMLLTALQKWLWSVQSHVPISGYEILRQVFLAVLLGWGGLSSLFYFIGRLAKKDPDFAHLAVLVAAAGLPLVLTTFVSAAVMAACLVLGFGGNTVSWQQVHTVIGWLGLVMGWPGWFSAMALHAGTKIKWRNALIICAGLLGLLLAGSLLPILIK